MKQRYSSHREISYNRETLEAYLEGNLEAELMEEIKEAEQHSEELAIRMEGLRFLLAQEGKEGADTFLAATQELHKEMIETHIPAPAPQAQTQPIFSYLVAAGIALLIGLGAFLINTNQGLDPFIQNELAQPFPLLNSQVRGTQTDENTWKSSYTEGAYGQVIQHLSTVPDIGEAEHFYLGMSYLYKEMYPSALTEYQAVMDFDNPNGYLEQARWYKAIGHAKIGDETAAKDLLQSILEVKGHFRQQEAERMLNKYL